MFPVVNFGTLERCRVPAGWRGRLTDIDPADQEGLPFPRPEAEAATASDIAEIDRLQEILYAQAKHALLVVLQGLDTSGKDGTVRKVFSSINPLGAVAVAFKKPTPPELAHDFLWRIHKAVPAAGMIGIFNRSHYEDVLVARVHGLVPPERVQARYDQINRFERAPRRKRRNHSQILPPHLAQGTEGAASGPAGRPYEEMEIQSR
jgi:polyphosphate kinase 2 (PPK2 family)